MPPQTYDTHVHQPRVWSVGWLFAVVAFLLLAWVAFREPTLLTFSLVLLGASVVIAVTVTRTFALRLQDRVIRLEMQTRLTRLGREADMGRVSLKQLIALRFAPDDELPALLDRAVAEQLTPDQIKRAIRQWQGDYLRT